MLEQFRTAKKAEIQQLKALAQAHTLPPALQGQRPSFSGALRAAGQPLAIIAEYKRASPSSGLICSHVPVEEAARQYTKNGACCLSILTESSAFQGELGFLDRAAAVSPLPLLRKDFIFHPLQVQATAATHAAALLLIVRLTPDVHLLRSLREQAQSYGIEAVVEVFDADELALARASGAKLIQVNARNLSNLSVDAQRCLDVAQQCPPQENECWIAASGICHGASLPTLAAAGYTAALVGSALMAGGQPGAALHALLHEATQDKEQATQHNKGQATHKKTQAAQQGEGQATQAGQQAVAAHSGAQAVQAKERTL